MQANAPGQVLDRTVIDPDGSKIGTVTELYLDEHADRAGWIAVRTGFFGQHVAPVPLAGAAESEGAIVVPFSKAQVKDAPHHDPEMAISREEEAALFAYYGIGYDDPESADYTTEDAARLRELLHGPDAQVGHTRLRRTAGHPVGGPVGSPVGEALPPDATGTPPAGVAGAADAPADGAGL